MINILFPLFLLLLWVHTVSNYQLWHNKRIYITRNFLMCPLGGVLRSIVTKSVTYISVSGLFNLLPTCEFTQYNGVVKKDFFLQCSYSYIIDNNDLNIYCFKLLILIKNLYHICSYIYWWYNLSLRTISLIYCAHTTTQLCFCW